MDLARDPSHANKVRPQGRKELAIGLYLERRGLLHRIIRDSTPQSGAEFIDQTTGKKWDIKSPVSTPKGYKKPRKGGAFEIKRFMQKVHKELANGHCLILDIRRLKNEHRQQLRNAIVEANISEYVIWYEKKGKYND